MIKGNPKSHPVRVVVTGAAGFVGSHTVDRLLREGHEVVGVDNLSTGRLENLSGARNQSGFTFQEGDIVQKGMLEEICRAHSPHTIIHLAALVSVTQAQAEPDTNFSLNIEGTHRVAEAARKHGVSRVVFASSAATYGENPDLPLSELSVQTPIGLYGAAKAASEQILFGYAFSYGSFEAVCLRYFNIFGPRQDPSSPYSGVISIFSEKFAKGEPITVFGDGNQTRDFVSVYDIARANVLAATKKEVGSYAMNICTGRQYKLLDLIDAFREYYPGAPGANHKPMREGEILDSCGDPRRARKMLGFEAAVDLKAGINDLIRYYERSSGTEIIQTQPKEEPLIPA